MINISKTKRRPRLRWLAIFYLAGTASLQVGAQATYPLNDVANPREACFAFTNASIFRDAQTIIPNATLVIRKGLVEGVGTSVPVPKDAVVINCKGKFIYPSFIDMYSDYGTQPVQRGGFNFGGQSQMLSNTRGAFGWNQAIKSEVDAARVFTVNEAKAKELRSNGFGTVLSFQMDGISRGTATLVTLASEKENKVMLKEKAAAGFSFDKGSSTQDYPNSLMGCIALLRQNFLDAQWYKTRPASEGTNLSLQAFNDNLSLPQVFESGDKWNDLRADKIGDEFGVQYIIRAAGNEYQRINDIKSTNASYIVPLSFPQAMDVEDPTDARYVSLADLKNWEMAPLNPGYFEKAGINFALTAYGLRDNSSFWPNLRKAVQNGLSEQKALEALTKTPATLLGVYDKIGSLEPGKIASFFICSAPVFSDRSVIYQNWIQGIGYSVKDEGWNDNRGQYNFTLNGEAYKLELKGEPARPNATLIGTDTTRVDISIQDHLVKMSFTFKKDSVANRLSGVISDDNWNGTGQLANGQWTNWLALKQPGETNRENRGGKNAGDSSRKKINTEATIAGTVSYPFDGYGFSSQPVAETILFKNATVWTNETEGRLENTDVLVKNGKIAAIGKNLTEPTARVIDATGKHLTAGIIDEHSHIAITGGVNECSQSVTAEVRVGDVVNPEDINIYRQLSGGVTSSHLLHGSCNTIGGQTQLIKLRWGSNAEQLKFANWDPFIKFALGENVKRSSNNQGNNRFPDTRMGVEQVLTDAFTRASDYQKAGPGKRKDLELETLAEILNKKRFITCHSYVQSEITSLMRVAEKFGFRVNTFTHILEGYKVADKMKAHGANAGTFSDWWAYKMEVQDAIPYNAYIMQQVGVNVAINSDDAEMARRLNQEAAKSIRYGGMKEEDALKLVTLNPAIMLHVADRTGSIKIGKDADLVLWSDHPLSIYAKAEKTMVDGIIYFDRIRDAQLRDAIARERSRLIQKMIGAKKSGERTGPATPSFQEENFCEEDHGHDNTIWERIASRMLTADK